MNQLIDAKSGEYQVFLRHPIPAEQVDRLCAISPSVRIATDLATANVIYTEETNFDLANAPRLRWIQLNTAGIGQIVGTPVAASGIPIANVRGAYTPAVAEYAIGLLMALAKRFKECHNLQSQSKWVEDYTAMHGTVLYGKTLAIVGYGNIGRHIARIAQSMGMRILACKRNPEIRQDEPSFHFENTGDPAGIIPAEWFGIDQMETMFRITDHVVVTLPLTTATRNLIGRRELSALQRHALFVNVGRGEIVDEVVLAEKLESRLLGGAALDVFAEEPLPSASPLWRTPNTIVTPHLASFTREAATFASDVLVENVRRDLAGQSLLNLVNVNAGY